MQQWRLQVHSCHHGSLYPLCPSICNLEQACTDCSRKAVQCFHSRFGFPAKIHYDQGAEFNNKLFHRLEQLCNIIHSRTTPYHPEENGQVERFHRTLLAMSTPFLSHTNPKWKNHLNNVGHACSCTHHESTSYSPFYLMFGHHRCLPIDFVFNLQSPANDYHNSSCVRHGTRLQVLPFDFETIYLWYCLS